MDPTATVPISDTATPIATAVGTAVGSFTSAGANAVDGYLALAAVLAFTLGALIWLVVPLGRKSV